MTVISSQYHKNRVNPLPLFILIRFMNKMSSWIKRAEYIKKMKMDRTKSKTQVPSLMNDLNSPYPNNPIKRLTNT